MFAGQQPYPTRRQALPPDDADPAGAPIEPAGAKPNGDSSGVARRARFRSFLGSVLVSALSFPLGLERPSCCVRQPRRKRPQLSPRQRLQPCRRGPRRFCLWRKPPRVCPIRRLSLSGLLPSTAADLDRRFAGGEPRSRSSSLDDHCHAEARADCCLSATLLRRRKPCRCRRLVPLFSRRRRTPSPRWDTTN
jgi:hypothetical protein